MGLTKTSLGDGAFGGLACLSVIEHGVSLDAYLAEAWRLLRPGGVLVTSTDFWCEPLDVEGKEAYGTPVRIFVPDDIRSFVETARAAGFRLDGSLDVRCGDRVVTWERLGLSYTFVNIARRKPSTARERLLGPRRGLASADVMRAPT